MVALDGFTTEEPTMPKRIDQLAQARALAQKLGRIAAMNAPFAFRLAAMAAADCRPGKSWA